MKTTIRNTLGGLAFASALILNLQPPTALAQGTAFTYQGRLDSGGSPANGSFDFRFAIFDAASGGSQVGGPLTNSATAVSNGLFTVTLDFGAGVFTGPARWLDIGVRTNGGGAFSVLTLRQPISSAPYAIRALNAGTAATATSAASVSTNAVATAGLQDNSVTSAKIADGTITAADVNAASFGTTFWKTDGNAGTTPGTHFLGTTDNQPLELHANNQRALRLEPTTSGPPNVIAGLAANRVETGMAGATISGGGVSDYPNVVSNHFGTIGGGTFNRASGVWATIAGGRDNFTDGDYTAIGGGWGNLASNSYATVGGGVQNTARGPYAIVGGGWANIAQGNGAAVVGGSFNSAHGNGTSVGGGWENTATNDFATVGGGRRNIAQSRAATVSGGIANEALGVFATVSGGASNTVLGGWTTVSGGRENFVRDSYSTVGGGYRNRAHMGDYVSIGGGLENLARGHYTTVAGGQRNDAGGPLNADGATVGGGENNTAANFYATVGGGLGNIADGRYSTVCGGLSNSASGDYATVGGGLGNIADGYYSTVCGGRSNSASGEVSFAAGNKAQALHEFSFVWSSYQNPSPSFAHYTFFVNAPNGLGVNCGAQRPDGGGQYWMNLGRVAAGGQLIETSVGATLTLAGVWQNASDQHRKTDFEPVDVGAVLQKVLALPVRQWRFTNELAGVRHLGPTAQDFHAAFGLGDSDTSIGTVDADGVALAAIQGLNQKLEVRSQELGARSQELEVRSQESAARIQKLEAENVALRNELAELRQRVRLLAAQPNGGGR